jgi:hypothetical protein
MPEAGVVAFFHREIEHMAFAKMKSKAVLSPDDEEAQGAALYYFMSFHIFINSILQVLLFSILNVVLNRTDTELR